MTRRLFAYGTLRGNAMLAPYATLIGPATTSGRLFNLGAYPGLVRGDGEARGELYEIAEEHWERVIAELDDYEGDQYVRELIRVATDEGETDAWAYIFVESTEDLDDITSWPPK